MAGFKPIYLLLIIFALLGWLAQWRLRKIYFHYLEIPNKRGKNGREAAQALLSFYGLDIPMLETERQLSNFYNPQNKTLNFCKKIAETASVTSLGIVAHEVGHAVQDNRGFQFMEMRNRFAKILAITGQLSPLVFIWGVFFRNLLLVYTGVLLLFGMVIFALISLPVELNASSWALEALEEVGLADREEIGIVAVVLRHAAFTYVINGLQRIGTFLFIVLILTMIR